ncbi:hypothetical protein [Deinococcus koreensis]|uniref:Uncharacterized protein n=1 Tax=Deinococcus koreensis TaxID=2054903 RepID=A0A2K3UU00_9DEIO|nr:hypothetical protein [Deinococcus koreensis]PNY80015.1 hypothetical protein CVO96_00390 [Deinococcus koreensis]
MIRWLDVLIEGDPHPRRFDTPEGVRQYLLRVERLPEEAVAALLAQGEVGPPMARRAYRLRPLVPA